MNDITEQEMTRYFSNNLRLLRNGRTPPISQQQLANQLHVDPVSYTHLTLPTKA